MLTAELVHVRRKGRELEVVALSDRGRDRAALLAARYLELAREHVGKTREELDAAAALVEHSPRERRLALGLRKLIEDRCEFEQPGETDPEELRRVVFLEAAARRRAGAFARAPLLAELAAARALAPEELERGLYADLRAAQRITALHDLSAERLVEEYELGQAQAVLLRAVRVTVEVECATPGAYRALFGKLKFLRLLYTLAARPSGGYRIEIDGPFSLFESVTKYGLQLALALPAIRACDRWRLDAEVRWGKERQPLTVRLEGEGDRDRAPARLPDEVAALLEAWEALDTPWRAAPAEAVLELPGVGLCVPDLVFTHGKRRVFLEVLGFWSRQAVWRRVELVEKGLGTPIVFAVSQHLRVSEEALADELPAALYVYKRVLSAKALLERVEKVGAKGGAKGR